jgi:hypothetical protein
VASSTFFAWNSLPSIDREALISLVATLKFDASDRGDDAFYMFRKN